MMWWLRRSAVAVPALGASLLLAACAASPATDAGGGDHGGDHAAAESRHEPVDGAREVTVTAVDIDFQPTTLDLDAGESVNVTVVNEGEALHDFTLEAADVHVNVEPGGSEVTSVTIDEPGTYTARCTVDGHEAAGMTIDVVVSA